MLYMKKIKMESQNKYIGDDKFQNMLNHYGCTTPLNVIKMRFTGAVCSPNLDLRPTDVISSFWPKGQEPRLQTKEEADLFFKFFMGLWDEIFQQVKNNKISLSIHKKDDRASIIEQCNNRFDEVELGFIEGFWGGKQDINIPAYIAELLNSLSDLAKLYQTLAHRAQIENNIKNVIEVYRHTDKMVNRSIAFIIENFVLPRMNG